MMASPCHGNPRKRLLSHHHHHLLLHHQRKLEYRVWALPLAWGRCPGIISPLLILHWYNKVLYKRFLTPIRDGIWNRRQVSVGDRRGPSHTTQKPSGICPPGTHARQNEVVCDRRASKYGYTYSSAQKNTIIHAKYFSVVSTFHIVSPR